MARNSRIILVLLSLPLLFSCGTGKKLTAAQAEVDQLKSANAVLNTKSTDLTNTVSDLQKKVTDLTGSNQAMMNEYAKFKTDCQEAQVKLQVVRAVLEEQYATLQAVEKKLEDALVDFNNKGVQVYYKDGLVYVSMEDNLLYKSGSHTLNEKSKKALGALASVLNDYPKLKVYVVGNTDDQSFKNGGGNWTLSTERANYVVRTLRDSYKVDPSRMTSAGKGKYNPVADNGTAEGLSLIHI